MKPKRDFSNRLFSFFILFCIIWNTRLYAQQTQVMYPYQNPDFSAEQRAEDLVSRLTLEEKISLMKDNSPAISRLGIKPYGWWNEALHGVAREGIATVFPQCIGMAASFNDDLLYEVFSAISDEARVKNRIFNQKGENARYNGLTMWAPNINIFRDPRWGRGQETYGEDPYLTARMGTSVVKGLQGPENAKYNKLHACAKHFAVHSGPEYSRHRFNAENIDHRDLWETYLPAFKALVVDAKVKEVMCAYNRFEGEPCCGSNRLLHQILRDEWQFDGIIVSDCNAISDFYGANKHNVYANAKEASAAAVKAGTDLECGGNYSNLFQAVKDDLIDKKNIDISLKRVLKARFELGLMEKTYPWYIADSVVDCQKHRQLALQMARESIVLLQNNNILPLNKKTKIAVLGPNANDAVMQWGNYHGIASQTSTLLSALRERLPDSQIIYDPVCGLTNDITYHSLFNQCKINGQKGFQAIYFKEINGQKETIATNQLTTPFLFNEEGATNFGLDISLHNIIATYRTQFLPTKSGQAVIQLRTNGNITFSVNGMIVSEKSNVKSRTNIYEFSYEKGKVYDLELNFTQTKSEPSIGFDLLEKQTFNFDQLLNKIQGTDIVLFAGGISPSLEGEQKSIEIPGFKGGDRTNIELPAIQREILAKLKKAGKKIIYINFSGSAISLEPETKSCEAILQAWYPGEEGGNAIADILLGDYNPSGHLPITIYKNIAQLPEYENYSMKGRTYRYMKNKPLYPFGYGLSYTNFSYGNAKTNTTILKKENNLTLSIPLTNIGNRDGEEVVQIYLSRPEDENGPIKTLREFKRVKVAKGESKTISINLHYNSFEWFDPETNTMRPLSGNYKILYGGSSQDEALKSLDVYLE